MKLKMLAIMMILLITCTSFSVSSKTQNENEIKNLTSNSTNMFDKYVELLMKIGHMPSTVVCAIKDDEVVFAKAYGTYDLENNKAANIDTVYAVGSIAKTVSATALMQLYEKGYFDLDDDVSEYLPFNLKNPNFPDVNITFRMLLAHQSSITDKYDILHVIPGDPYIPTRPYEPYLKEVLLPNGSFYVSGIWSNEYAPGQAYHYSNVGYGLVEYLVELISNKSFNDYCKENIFEPLEMNNSSYNLEDFNISKVAPYYIYLKGKYYRLIHMSWVPCCDLRSTIMDMSHFLIAHMNGGVWNGVRILNESTVTEMHSPQFSNYELYGLGFQLTDYKYKKNIIGHNGGPYNRMFYSPSDNTGAILFDHSWADPAELIMDEGEPCIRSKIVSFLMFKSTSFMLRSLLLKASLE